MWGGTHQVWTTQPNAVQLRRMQSTSCALVGMYPMHAASFATACSMITYQHPCKLHEPLLLLLICTLHTNASLLWSRGFLLLVRLALIAIILLLGLLLQDWMNTGLSKTCQQCLGWWCFGATMCSCRACFGAQCGPSQPLSLKQRLYSP